MQRTSLAPLLSATRSRDSCWIMRSLRPFQHFDEAPALELRERTGLLDADPVADVEIVGLVVDVQARGALHRLLVPGVGIAHRDGDDRGLVHAGRGHEAL